MPTLVIDNREVTVPEGMNVLDAAKAIDIVVPHFCYHEALGAIGSCRLCAMQFLEGPVQGVKMACMVPAQDGMVVSTSAAEAVELREHVIEWLMTNHPHDCPVCDEGGECLLQDMTIAGGHYLRRYRGKKATYTNQYLGPFIEQEMNRCITCYRCSRTYRDYCGGRDFGVFGSRNRVFFGRYKDGQLESPFSGNLVDICPTGVFTDKPFRFKSRIWDLQEAPSICPQCSLGCSTIPGGRFRELQRIRSGINQTTNGFFICDRGRFGYGHVNHPERPRDPRVDGLPVTMEEAITAARNRVDALAAKYGGASIAFLGSPRASLEGNLLLQAWAGRVGSSQSVFDAHQGRDHAARSLAANLASLARSLSDVRQSDLIILIGADPLAEGPSLALAIRQAVRQGSEVIVIDPRPVALPCAHQHIPLPPQLLHMVLKALESGQYDELNDAQTQPAVKTLRSKIAQAKLPVLIGGADMLGGLGVKLLCDAAKRFISAECNIGVMVMLSGPNSFGGAFLNIGGPDFDALIDAFQEGRVRGLVCLESDPFREAQFPAKAQAALGHLELLISIDCTPTLAAKRADIFMPSRATAEMAGSFINNEGRLQAFHQAIEPGMPLSALGPGKHPPRLFQSTTPGATPQPAWQILGQLLDRPADLNQLRRTLAAENPKLKALTHVDTTAARICAEPNGIAAALTHEMFSADSSAGNVPLLITSAFVGSHWLSHLSSPLKALREEPTVWLHPSLAATLGLKHGERAILSTTLGRCHVRVQTSNDMAQELALTYQLLDSALEGMSPGTIINCRLTGEEGQ
ncbi:MAG: NADH-quinone oxidoreductase subunit NuoG [Deltaproteobacteria bacterium]|jgi:NADH-quinone oxidoreductase subunit G|nr:NADH-quinone oxidoreductase subunit NuoG [Deltaproteobacteria bacterium]